LKSKQLLYHPYLVKIKKHIINIYSDKDSVVRTVNRRDVVILSIAFVLGLVLGMYLVTPHLMTQTQGVVKLGEKKTSKSNALVLGFIDVEVRDRYGKLLLKRTYSMHSPVENFAKLLLLIFDPRGGDLSTSVVDLGGTSKKIGYSDDSYSYEDTWCCVRSDRWFIAFGNGTATFSRSAYKLANELVEIVISTPTVSVTESNITLVFSASYSPSSDVNITEVGLILQFDPYDADNNNYAKALMFYDVLPEPVSVPAGGSITVTYRIVFP